MPANALIMVVDDDQQIREMLRAALTGAGHDVVEAADGLKALEMLEENLPDLILVDMKMPGMDGLSVIEEVRNRDPQLPVIMLTGHGTTQTAVQAMKFGACDFIQKPFDIQRLRDAVSTSLQSRAFRREVWRMRDEQVKRLGEIGTNLIGSSPSMRKVYRTIRQVSSSPTTTVLIQGESGTGKELIAKAVHLCSERKDKAFVEINCAALTESLLESEIFGYEPGAFTGAVNKGKPGLFEVADGGTIFLDEIGEMGLPLPVSYTHLTLPTN